MTPEQLDEIEKLAEAANAGPWARTHSVEVADLWAADGAIPILRAWSDVNIDFIAAMRAYALPLIWALRGAREALDEREGDMHDRIRAGYDKTVADCWRAHCAKIEKQRDEALAEMDEFAIAVGYGERPEGQSGVHRLSGAQLADRWKQLEREIDEVRAELARWKERGDTLIAILRGQGLTVREHGEGQTPWLTILPAGCKCERTVGDSPCPLHTLGVGDADH